MKNSPEETRQIQRIPSVYVDTKMHPGYARIIQDCEEVLILDKVDAEILIRELQKFVEAQKWVSGTPSIMAMTGSSVSMSRLVLSAIFELSFSYSN